MESVNFPLSNVQLELLKLFSRDIGDNDLKEIKKLIVAYLSKKLLSEADKVWDKKNWSNENMEEILSTHLRIAYKESK